jgi:hypothetical protein
MIIYNCIWWGYYGINIAEQSSDQPFELEVRILANWKKVDQALETLLLSGTVLTRCDHFRTICPFHLIVSLPFISTFVQGFWICRENFLLFRPQILGGLEKIAISQSLSRTLPFP